MLLQILAFIHTLATVAAVGANVTYFVWLRRALDNPDARLFTLQTIRLLERRYVLPAYILVGLTGLGLVDRSGREWSTPWIEVSILLFVVLMAVGGFYARLFRQQIALAEAGESGQGEYAAINRKNNILAVALTVVVVFLIYLMAFQPTLWG